MSLSLIKIVCYKGHFIFPNRRLKGAFYLFLSFFSKKQFAFFFLLITYFLIFKIFLGIQKVKILAVYYNLRKLF